MKQGRKIQKFNVHFTALMDICHLKNAELEAMCQKHKGRVVLRGDNVKDGSGAYAVFTEQGSFASQMTAAKVMDIFQGFHDAQDKQLMQYPLCASTLLIIPKSECPHIWIRVPKHKWPKS